MARAAVLGRLTWRVATVTAINAETATASTLSLDVPGWLGHVAGQHLDVRLTAENGYTAQRSYSIASASEPDRIELTVQWVANGEVSPYLVESARPGDRFEVRGPIGGYFTWHPDDPGPALLVAGGSGIVPLMSMLRTRAAAGSQAPFRLIFSVRSPAELIYAGELRRRAHEDRGLEVGYVYTRRTPDGWPQPPGRLNAATLAAVGWPADTDPRTFVCGPTGFVETVAELLVDQGHAATRIKTERFGPTGGGR
ncbi:MAG: ferredoxin reductase [Sporichthyaceae bacterium]|nr:ferredoxin reductase [Sporichthyaceae bacterium]